jgi:hypothetical protein
MKPSSPAYLNALVRFAEGRNFVFARVPSHFKRGLLKRRKEGGCLQVRSSQEYDHVNAG